MRVEIKFLLIFILLFNSPAVFPQNSGNTHYLIKILQPDYETLHILGKRGIPLDDGEIKIG
ncbi:MAG: hypothetical protein ACE5QV_10010, partial [Fidelibacterota bacterium]